MSNPAKIDDIVDGMMMQNDSIACHLDRQTGEILSIFDDEGSLDGDEKYEESLELMETEPERFVELPSGFDIDEWQIMEQFALQVKEERVSESLLSAIRGKGAFGRFKAGVDVAGLMDQWYLFKENAFRDLAIDWCQQNEVAFVEDSPR